MPERVSYVLCNRELKSRPVPLGLALEAPETELVHVRAFTPPPTKCVGRLEFLAKTAVDCGMQYGDPASQQFFYRCDACGTVYTGETDLPESMIRYGGKLTVDEIKEHIPGLLGTVSEADEEAIMLKTRPSELVLRRTVGKDYKDLNFGVGSITKCLMGRMVEIRVVEPESPPGQ